jgi:hypothetical protein
MALLLSLVFCPSFGCEGELLNRLWPYAGASEHDFCVEDVTATSAGVMSGLSACEVPGCTMTDEALLAEGVGLCSACLTRTAADEVANAIGAVDETRACTCASLRMLNFKGEMMDKIVAMLGMRKTLYRKSIKASTLRVNTFVEPVRVVACSENDFKSVRLYLYGLYEYCRCVLSTRSSSPKPEKRS